MTLLPVVERELRVAARRAWVYWLRVAAAGLVIGVWLLLLLAAGGGWSPQRLGLALFNGVSIPAFVFALFTGVFLTADCISSERREGTLGLLFLTDLRGHDIALGKLAATSLHAASGLLAIVPMLALPLMLGGVTGLMVATRALTILLAALLSLTAGLLCSTLLGETRKALPATLALLMALVGLPLLAGYVQAGLKLTWLSFHLYQFSPAYTLSLTQHASNAAVGAFFWPEFARGCGWQMCLSLGFLALASWRLPRVALEENPPLNTAPAPTKQRRKRWPGGAIHPFWFAGQDRSLTRLLFVLLLLGWMAWFGLSLLAFLKQDNGAFSFSLIPAYAVHVLLKCQFAAEAARRFAQDRASGALEMLLSTPLKPREILDQSWAALQRRFRAAQWLALSLNAGLLMCFLAGGGFNAPPKDWPLITLLMLGAGGLLFLDCRALAWTAMLEGMRGRKPLRAALGAVGRVLVPMWAGISLYLFLGFSGLLNDDAVTKALVVLWFLAGTALDVVLANRARTLLQTHFRLLAVEEALPQVMPGDPERWGHPQPRSP